MSGALEAIGANLTDTDVVKFADAFGVMPSTTEGLKQFAAKFPDSAAFVAGAEYGTGPVNLAGLDDVINKFNSQLATLTGTAGDPAAWLADLQKNGTAALAG